MAKDLVELLGHSYDSVWYDTAKLVGGDDWWAKILDQIEKCNHFIFLLSPESVDSEWCLKELNSALDHKKHIIPVMIRERTPIPDLIKSIHKIDSYSEITRDGLNEIYAAIIRNLNAKKNSNLNREISSVDERILNLLWRLITGRKIRTLLREVEIESISSETFNDLDEFKNLRSLPEYKFLDSILEKSFSDFSRILSDFSYNMSLNVFYERYTDSYVSARQSASNEGRVLPHETEAILRYEKEVVSRVTSLYQQHTKLVKSIKTLLPNFELEKV